MYVVFVKKVLHLKKIFLYCCESKLWAAKLQITFNKSMQLGQH